MHPIHDVDALLLLALALAAKRRPAELVELVAAVDLLQGTVPSELKLCEAFHRLSAHGLVVQVEDGFTLSPEAQELMTGGRRKADTEARILGLKEKLAAYEPELRPTPIPITPKQVCVAILAHRAAGKSSVQNLLVPKPKPEDAAGTPPGQRQRKPLPARRRKG